MKADQVLKVNQLISVYCACVISRSSNDVLRLKVDGIRPTKINMTAKFVEQLCYVYIACLYYLYEIDKAAGNKVVTFFSIR